MSSTVYYDFYTFRGYIQFRLCPHNDPTTPADQACFDQNLLEVLELNGAPFSGTKVPVPADLMDYRVKLQLPPGLTCTQCVLQWHYLTGNGRITLLTRAKRC